MVNTKAKSLKELLTQTHPFAALTQTEQIEFAQNAIPRRYKKSDFCAYQGDVWPYLLLVGKGKVNIVKESPEGRSLIVQTLEVGDIFWGLAFFQDNVPMPVTLQASQISHLYLWDRAIAQPILLRNSNALWKLCQLMAVRMERANKIVEDLAFSPVTGRLAGLILSHYGDAMGDYTKRNMTLDEMAARIGSTREMVCRLLYQFSDEGAVRITRTEFMISDQEKLKGFARKVKG